MKITKNTLKELDRKIAVEKDLKRKVFLMAARNRYSSQLGVKAPYVFAED